MQAAPVRATAIPSVTDALRAVESLLMSSGQRTARRNAWTSVLEDRRRAKDRVEAQHVLEAAGRPAPFLHRPRRLRRHGEEGKLTAWRRTAAANPGRLKQIALTYKMTRKADSKVGLVVAAVGIVTFGVFLAIGFLIGHPIYLGILGFLLAFLAMAIVFGRRAERAAFGQMEGQPGAAAAVLENVGRGWTTTPAVAMNRSQDVVHRAVGKAGIVLVAEGNPNRVKSLLAAEKKKMARIVRGRPGARHHRRHGEGQVPLKKVRTTMLKLPRVLTGPQVTAANDRLRAHGRPDEQHAAAEGPDAQGHADAEAADRCADPSPTNVHDTRAAPDADPSPGRLSSVRLRASASARVVPRSDPDLDGAGQPVVQAAAVAVPDQGRDRRGRAARCAATTRDEAEPAAVLGDHPQAEEPLAGGEADRADGEHAEHEEDARAPSCRRPAGHRRAISPYAISRHRPQSMTSGAEPPPEAGDRARPLLAAGPAARPGSRSRRPSPRRPRGARRATIRLLACCPPVHGTARRFAHTAGCVARPTRVRLTWAKQMGHAREIPPCLWSASSVCHRTGRTNELPPRPVPGRE